MLYSIIIFWGLFLNDYVPESPLFHDIRIDNYFQQHTLQDFYLEMSFPLKVKIKKQIIKRSNTPKETRGKLVYTLKPQKRKTKNQFELYLYMYEPYLEKIEDGIIYCPSETYNLSQLKSGLEENMFVVDNSKENKTHLIVVKEIFISEREVYFFVFEVVADPAFLVSNNLDKTNLIELWSKAEIKSYSTYY